MGYKGVIPCPVSWGMSLVGVEGPPGRSIKFGMVYSWGLLIVSGFTIMGWKLLIPLG